VNGRNLPSEIIMEQLKTAAFGAGAQKICVRTHNVPVFPPVMRGTLMPALRTIRQEMGLSTGDLLVLGALMSFLPCRDAETGTERQITSDMVLVVFAGNAALCDRAHGMDERVLRRHLSRLGEVGLIRRKQSATGKRFPLRRAGVIRDAFGIDLSPLLERHLELSEQAQETRRRAEELRAERAEALALRGQIVETVDPEDATQRSFLDQVKTVLRRATLTVEMVRDQVRRMRGLLSGTDTGAPSPAPKEGLTAQPDVACSSVATSDLGQPRSQVSETDQNAITTSDNDAIVARTTDLNTPPNPARLREQTAPNRRNERHEDRPWTLDDTDKMSGGDGRNVRQQEQYQIDIKKRNPRNQMSALWDRCQMVALTHPSPPEDELDLLRVIYEFGQLSPFDTPTLAEATRRIGPARLLETLDRIAQKKASITCPHSYLRTVVLSHSQA
jgi:replication initiation protein RepC